MKIHVDDRLVHGQILYGWCPYYNVKEIVVISEKVMDNDFQKMLMQATVISPMKLQFLALEEALVKKSSKVLYLFDDLNLVKTFYSMLLEVDSALTDAFIISNLSQGPMKMKIAPSIYLSEGEKQIIQELKNKGIKCILAQDPSKELGEQ